MDRAGNFEKDSARAFLGRVNGVAQRAFAAILQRGDVIDIAAASALCLGAKPFRAGEGGDGARGERKPKQEQRDDEAARHRVIHSSAFETAQTSAQGNDGPRTSPDTRMRRSRTTPRSRP